MRVVGSSSGLSISGRGSWSSNQFLVGFVVHGLIICVLVIFFRCIPNISEVWDRSSSVLVLALFFGNSLRVAHGSQVGGCPLA